MIIGRTKIYQAWKNRYSFFWKKRRFCKIMNLVSLPAQGKIKVLEVGCANGKDFIRFLARDRFEVWGVDTDPNCGAEDIHFVNVDAAALPFRDKEFDLVVSIGLLEHIEPMDKLCRVIAELDRVGKRQISVVPSIATPVEPHSGKLFFPLRLWRDLLSDRQKSPLHLNFFTEHTWTKFPGFHDCALKRFFYIPPLIRNTVIYKDFEK